MVFLAPTNLFLKVLENLKSVTGKFIGKDSIMIIVASFCCPKKFDPFLLLEFQIIKARLGEVFSDFFHFLLWKTSYILENRLIISLHYSLIMFCSFHNKLEDVDLLFSLNLFFLTFNKRLKALMLTRQITLKNWLIWHK